MLTNLRWIKVDSLIVRCRSRITSIARLGLIALFSANRLGVASLRPVFVCRDRVCEVVSCFEPCPSRGKSLSQNSLGEITLISKFNNSVEDYFTPSCVKADD